MFESRSNGSPSLLSARAAALMALVIAALCFAAGPPAHAQAATVAWSSQKPPVAYCGPWKSIGTGYGYANIRDCLKTTNSASGTIYHNGVLEVQYHRVTGAVGDVLGGKSAIASVGYPVAIGVNDCPPVRWLYDETRWCYSPTKVRPTGQKFYGKGVLVDHAGRWILPVWSPVVPDKAG